MKKGVSVLIVIVCGLLIGSMVYGAQEAEPMGYSTACCEKDNLVFENDGDGVDETSVFELASNGKVIGAYIALKLVDEGKLRLDDSIALFLDESFFTDDKRIYDITLRQLLCHTAGFSESFELGIDKKLYSNPGEKFRYSGVGYIYLQNVIENVSGMTMEQAANRYVFEPLGMVNSTFEHAKTVTPYMRLSSVVIYAFTVFLIAFMGFLLIAFVIGKVTKFRFFSFRKSVPVCFMLGGIVNTLFVLYVVPKVAVIFWLCFAVMGLFLFLARKKEKIFYAGIPIMMIVVFILGFAAPVSVPVTNDIVAKAPNCAYTLKSTCEDMALFCQELMEQYHARDGAVGELFLAAVDIDTVNWWGAGIAIESESQGESYWHSGINPGFQSLFVLYPLQDKYIIVLTNSDDGLLFAKEAAKDFLAVDGRWDIPR